MNIKTTIFIIAGLIINIHSYASVGEKLNEATQSQINTEYDKAKKIAEITKKIKEIDLEKIGIRKEYKNNELGIEITNKLLGELKGCYAMFLGNRELNNKEKNFFQINTINFEKPNHHEPELNKAEKRELNEQKIMCENLIRKPIELLCDEQFIDINSYKRKVPDFKGVLINTENLLDHIPQPKEDEPIIYKSLIGLEIKSINQCSLNKELKNKNITTTFESYYIKIRHKGELEPYIDNVYKDKQMYKINLEYKPITNIENKTIKAYTITIRPEDLTIKERIIKFIDEITSIAGIIGFFMLFFKGLPIGIF